MSDAVSEIMIALGALTVVAVGLGFGVMFLRRRLKSEGPDPSLGAGFTLADIDAMRQSGQIDDAQYRTLRQHVAGRVRGGGAHDAKSPGLPDRQSPNADREKPPSLGGGPGDPDPPRADR